MGSDVNTQYFYVTHLNVKMRWKNWYKVSSAGCNNVVSGILDQIYVFY